MKKKVDVIILGGTGLLGSKIVKLYIDKKINLLNLDIKKHNIKSKYYNFEKLDMTSNQIEKKINNIFKMYTLPKVYIDSSYINRKLFKNISLKKIKKRNLDKVLNNWLSSSVIICSIVLNKMKKNKIKGSVILTSSIYSKVAQDPNVYKNTEIVENIAYTMIKSSINNFVKNAATQYGPSGIRINSISPGGIKSNKDKNFNNKNFLKNYLKKVPIKRFATAQEIACIYEFLGSSKSSYITGINLIADGGYTLT